MVENEKRINVVEMAKRKRHIHLLEKLQKGKSLTPTEIKDLSRYEEGPVQPGIVENQEQVAKAFGVSARTVRHWIKDNMPVTKDGRYDLKEIQAWRFIKGKRRDSGQKKNLDNWEAKYREFKAKTAEIEYRKKLGELIPRADVERGLVQIIIAVKRAFLALPRAMAPQLMGLEPRQIEALLNVRIKEIIKMFSEDRIFAEKKIEKKSIKKHDKAKK